MSFHKGYRVIGYAAHALANGKVRLGGADAIPLKNGWRYLYPSNRFFAAKPVREEILRHLEGAGSDHSVYTISLQHAIVLYPEVITLDDLDGMDAGRVGDFIYYVLMASLPFGETRTRVRVVIDTSQEEPLRTDKTVPRLY
jgi:hypothetical protein